MSQNGKGDDPRPRQVSRTEYESNWNRVFGHKRTKAPREKSQKRTKKS
jgi:hypothetical protein